MQRYDQPMVPVEAHIDFPLIANAHLTGENTVNMGNECHQMSCQLAQSHLSRLNGIQHAFLCEIFTV